MRITDGVRPVTGTPNPASIPLPESLPGFGESLDALLGPTSPVSTTAKPLANPAAGTDAPGGIQFSRHAAARLESRGIRLEDDDLTDLGKVVDQLARRGAKESLVLMGDHAFIVGVPDRKVITALSRQEAAGGIFTRIDSTAVVR